MRKLNELNFKVSDEVRIYNTHTKEITIMIENYIKTNNMTKKVFADLVGKLPSDVSKWISGNFNFTLLTISLIESKTGMVIINKLSKSEISDFIDGKVF